MYQPGQNKDAGQTNLTLSPLEQGPFASVLGLLKSRFLEGFPDSDGKLPPSVSQTLKPLHTSQQGDFTCIPNVFSPVSFGESRFPQHLPGKGRQCWRHWVTLQISLLLPLHLTACAQAQASRWAPISLGVILLFIYWHISLNMHLLTEYILIMIFLPPISPHLTFHAEPPLFCLSKGNQQASKG